MAERPVECTHCKKPIKVIYKEIIGNSIVTTEMCADCPMLEVRLHGTAPAELPSVTGKEMGLLCNNCHTTLESIRTGNPLGCIECYNVFGDEIVNDLIEEGSIPRSLQKQLPFKKAQPIHIGKTPSKPINIPPSSRLISLNEALNEALRKENFEQAAWLRDQIKTLREKGDVGQS